MNIKRWTWKSIVDETNWTQSDFSVKGLFMFEFIGGGAGAMRGRVGIVGQGIILKYHFRLIIFIIFFSILRSFLLSRNFPFSVGFLFAQGHRNGNKSKWKENWKPQPEPSSFQWKWSIRHFDEWDNNQFGQNVLLFAIIECRHCFGQEMLDAGRVLLTDIGRW